MRYLVFLDESGTPKKPEEPKDRYYLLTAFIIPSREMNELYNIIELIIERVRNEYKLPISQELKGFKIFNKILSRYSKDKYKHASEQYAKFIEDIFSVFVYRLNYNLIIYAIDKHQLDPLLFDFIKKLESVDTTTISNYLNILKYKEYIEKIFDFLEDDLLSYMRRYVYPMQLVGETILRIEKLMREKGSEKREKAIAELFFDAEAKTISSSLYAIISEKILSKGDIPSKYGGIPIEHIETYFLADSKLNPGIQIADLVSYTMHRFLSYNIGREYLGYIIDDIFFISEPIEKLWGYKIKVIPWRKEAFLKLFRRK